MPSIVQFTHPGDEHSHDKNNINFKSWNIGKHKRKFLKATGEYVENNNLETAELLFWGEWEPPSIVSMFKKKPTKFHPKWMHIPVLPIEIPNPISAGKSYQNTDPCVFDGEFKYFVCKQFRNKTQKPTKLSKLEKGSLVLFGSTGNQNKENAFFQLDTVFVISHYIEYDSSDSDPITEPSLKKYIDLSLKMAFPNPTKNSIKMRLYFGATYQNRVNEMYSFSPSKLYNGLNSGFPRLALKDLNYLTNNLNAAPKVTECSNEVIKSFWNEIVKISRSNGFVEGVSFNFNNLQ